MSKQEFILKLLDEGKEYLKMVLPVLLALHMPRPHYMEKPRDDISKPDVKPS